uniref:Uncharacterized protein n=1 Tax=Heliothis virescens TaxID=7102 RepID=A0A2A4JEZ9_HELVI
MRSALLAALLVSAAALAARESSTVKAPSSGDEREPEQEDESDSAPFMSDWGAGVVCDGKLCGVLSRSARGAHASSESGDAADASTPRDDTCGDTHVAQSVARWRKFLHCAHTLRACGLGGDCAQLCSERRLLDTEETTPTARAERFTTTEPADTRGEMDALLFPRTDTLPTLLPSTSRPVRPSSVAAPTRSTLRRSSAAGMQPAPASSQPPSLRPAFEFEPNRPDFKGKPARTSRVYLKAGEYGDNGAEYGGEEAALPPAPSTPASVATRHSSTASHDARSSKMMARVSPATARRSHASALSANLLYVFMAITNFAI